MSVKESKGRKVCQLSIRGINEQAKAGFIEFNKSRGVPYHETFLQMWNYFKYFYTPLDQEESELARQAVEIAGDSFKKAKKIAIMQLFKKIISNSSKKKKIVKKIVDKNIPNSPAAADLRIEEIVGEMIAHNDREKKWYNRRFISKKSIENYAAERKRTLGTYLPSIKVIERYMENHKALLEEHHLKHGMDNDHNRKAYNYHKINKNYKKELEECKEHEKSDAVKKEKIGKKQIKSYAMDSDKTMINIR